jgi:hypothetical protein
MSLGLLCILGRPRGRTPAEGEDVLLPVVPEAEAETAVAFLESGHAFAMYDKLCRITGQCHDPCLRHPQ